jgi:hypothetical protein
MAKVDYTPMYLEAVKEMKLAHEALVSGKFQAAYEHTLNAQTELKLMRGAVKSWIPTEEE